MTAQRNTLAASTPRPRRYESQWYAPVSVAAGQVLDRVEATVKKVSATLGGPPVTGAEAGQAVSTSLSYDLSGHLTRVTRSAGESESLWYGPGGELVGRQVGERFVFYVGEYATVTAWGVPGCGASCAPQAGTVEVDAHVVFAGTRIASAKSSRTLYYYRTRLGTVVATSLGGGLPGAGYRYTSYGEVELAVNETEATRSELGYTNALRLTGSLLYLKNRVYDAEARVFLQPDTVDRLRYAYVWGDPVNLSDPTGFLPADFAPVVMLGLDVIGVLSDTLPNELAVAMRRPGTRSHALLFDTKRLREYVDADPPFVSLLEMVESGGEMTLEVLFWDDPRGSFFSPCVYVKVTRFEHEPTLCFHKEKGRWRLWKSPDPSCS